MSERTVASWNHPLSVATGSSKISRGLEKLAEIGAQLLNFRLQLFDICLGSSLNFCFRPGRHRDSPLSDIAPPAAALCCAFNGNIRFLSMGFAGRADREGPKTARPAVRCRAPERPLCPIQLPAFDHFADSDFVGIAYVWVSHRFKPQSWNNSSITFIVRQWRSPTSTLGRAASRNIPRRCAMRPFPRNPNSVERRVFNERRFWDRGLRWTPIVGQPEPSPKV